MEKIYDIAIIGGGVNGTAIARDAAGRGLRVFLCEKDDLAGHTSSASTKLIHGGLRYLEHYEFRLVREALQEREVLLKSAPHIIWPMRFVLPHLPHMRPKWLIKIGLSLYDRLGGRSLLAHSGAVDLSEHKAGKFLKNKEEIAFEYSDCWVQDSRLTVLNAVDAAENGAKIMTQTRLEKAEANDGIWQLECSERDGKTFKIQSYTLVNATGPWAAEIIGKKVIPSHNPKNLRLVKGSHLVVKKLFTHEFSYIFQNDDGRVVFAIPYENDFTLIGTTDVDFEGDINNVEISPEEVDYLIDISNKFFKKSIKESDIVWSFSGVRPLYDNGEKEAKKVTRDYVLELEKYNKSPVLHVFGGKITTSRKLAEHALEKIGTVIEAGGPWTKDAFLPGGDVGGDVDNYLKNIKKKYKDVPAAVLNRWVKNYGCRIEEIMQQKSGNDSANLGREVAFNVFEVELRYLMEKEFAITADDVLWRRTKLGLHLLPAERQSVAKWVRDYWAARADKKAG